MKNTAFKLEDAGFSRPQIDALTEFMDGNVASKTDIERLSGELKTDIERLSGKINAVNERLTGKINITYWMNGLIIAGVSSIVIKSFFG